MDEDELYYIKYLKEKKIFTREYYISKIETPVIFKQKKTNFLLIF